MPIALRLVDRGLAQAQDAVRQHGAALAEVEARDEALLVALRGNDLVAAILGEERRPLFVAAVVYARGVLAGQVLDRKSRLGLIHSESHRFSIALPESADGGFG